MLGTSAVGHVSAMLVTSAAAGHVGAMLGPCWGCVPPAMLRPCWGPVPPAMLGPCWGCVLPAAANSFLIKLAGASLAASRAAGVAAASTVADDAAAATAAAAALSAAVAAAPAAVSGPTGTALPRFLWHADGGAAHGGAPPGAFAGVVPSDVPGLEFFTADAMEQLYGPDALTRARGWVSDGRVLFCGDAAHPNAEPVGGAFPEGLPLTDGTVWRGACPGSLRAQALFDAGLTWRMAFNDNDAACAFRCVEGRGERKKRERRARATARCRGRHPASQDEGERNRKETTHDMILAR
eukprot:361500-Chlamydomonas_euryale.AAC.2